MATSYILNSLYIFINIMQISSGLRMLPRIDIVTG